MMIHGRINDNHPPLTITEVFKPLAKDISSLDLFCREIGGRSLAELRTANPRLLIFPCDFEGIKDDIKKSSIFHVNGDYISTGNVMGFVGKGGVSLSISSRFYPDSNDFFLHYLLQKVAGFHVVNLPTQQGKDFIWEFLPYLFPAYFMAAWKQGIFRVNRRFTANDDRIKGTIDIARHIRQNIPFRGRVAYAFSERTPLNPVNRLIRLTIDVLEHSSEFKAMFHGANKAFNDAIRDFKLLVPLETFASRSKILKDNLRPVAHPFYLKYKPLQQLCLAILRHDKISLGEDDEEIVGLLFHGAWLWEEYLATIMPKAITHAENILTTNAVYALKSREWPWYPDFFCKQSHEHPGVVFDAKYKHETPAADQHQIVSYMYVLQAHLGGFIYPQPHHLDAVMPRVSNAQNLNGFGGKIQSYHYPIAVGCKTFSQFVETMQQEEAAFAKWIEEAIDGCAKECHLS